MSLCKTVDDEWTPKGVKSTFEFVPPADRSSGLVLQTPICGLGWRFSCSIEGRQITLFFDPHLVQSAAYGTLSCSIDVKNLFPLDDVLYSREFSCQSTAQLGAWVYTRETAIPTITIAVKLSSTLELCLPRSLDARVEDTLVATIRGEEAVDVKFYAFSKKGPGYVARPQPIFGKASLLKGFSKSLDLLISGGGCGGPGGFTESKVVDLDRHSIDETYFRGYDYMSDSDLDTDIEDEEEAPRFEVHGLPGRGRMRTSPMVPEDRSPTPETEVSYGTIDLACEVPLPLSPPLRTSVSLPRSPVIIHRRRMGRVVVMRGTAFKTLSALLYYLYTKKIRFYTSGSLRLPIRNPSKTPECSAKSMYRLADQFGLDDLKALALSSVRDQMSPKNVVRDAFSTFSLRWFRYPEIEAMEVAYLIDHLAESAEDLGEMLRSICRETPRRARPPALP
ncbi:hypothetical protein DFH09DRAFT_397564 [Mycena vulgaris]|nr:hypothetical protein DFH09DRAFT_397564 [Mycena vulgaris]